MTLTGLHNENRRALLILFVRTQMSHAQQTYAVLLMDIDFFKGELTPLRRHETR